MFNSFRFNTRRYNQFQKFIDDVVDIVSPTVAIAIIANDTAIALQPLDNVGIEQEDNTTIAIITDERTITLSPTDEPTILR